MRHYVGSNCPCHVAQIAIVSQDEQTGLNGHGRVFEKLADAVVGHENAHGQPDRRGARTVAAAKGGPQAPGEGRADR